MNACLKPPVGTKLQEVTGGHTQGHWTPDRTIRLGPIGRSRAAVGPPLLSSNLKTQQDLAVNQTWVPDAQKTPDAWRMGWVRGLVIPTTLRKSALHMPRDVPYPSVCT